MGRMSASLHHPGGRLAIGLWLATLLILVCGGTLAAAPIDDDVRRIAKQLRCPICESVSVADSPAELAVQMRGVIRSKLEAGQSEQEIVDYFVAAYGDSVLLEPPRRGLALAAWLGPVAVLLLGAGTLALVLRGWVRRGNAPPSDNDRPASPSPAANVNAAQARAELDAVRKGLAG